MSTKGIIKSTLIIAAFGLVGKLLGFGREAVLAAYFGASQQTDAYLLALVVPGVLFGVVREAIETVAVPVFSEVRQSGSPEEYRKAVWSSFHLIISVSAGTALVAALVAPLWVPFVGPGLTGSQLGLALQVTRWVLPMIVFQTLAAWQTGYLQSRQRFGAPATTTLPYNIILILAIIVSARTVGIRGVAVGTVLATASQALIQLPAVRREGVPYRWTFEFRNPALRKMAVLLAPVTIGVGAAQVNPLVDRLLASNLPEGSISALNFAQLPLWLPYGLFCVPLITVLYSHMSQRVVAGEMEEYRAHVDRGFGALAVLVLPLSAGLFLLSTEVVQLLFQRGAFSGHDVQLTAGALAFYSLGLPFLVWREYLNRACYAVQDTKTPMFSGIVMMVVNLVLSLLFIGRLQHRGLALATSTAGAVGMLIVWYRLSRRVGGIGKPMLVETLLKVIGATAVMGVSVWGLLHVFPPLGESARLFAQVWRLIVLVGCGAVVFGLTGWALGVDEIRRGASACVRLVSDSLRKCRRVSH